MLKKKWSGLNDNSLVYILLLLSFGALAYLLYIRQLGLYGDDWYLIFDGHTQGAAFIYILASSDRPARGYLMVFIYRLFGDHLVYYHLCAFLFRFLASLAFYWSLNMVWERNKFPHFLMALFLLIYPGFLNQNQPVSYLSIVCSLALTMISIALSLAALKLRLPVVVKIILWLFSALTGWSYLALVEYSIGLEFLRLFFIFCLLNRQVDGTWRRRLLRVLSGWLPFVIAPAGFAIWRVFIFKSTRAATDVNLRLSTFFVSPLLNGLHWLTNTLYSVLNVLLSAWIVPFYNLVITGDVRLRDTLVILAIGTGSALALLLGIWANHRDSQEQHTGQAWISQALWGGGAALVIGVIPIILTNRSVDLVNSRYTLAAAPGAILLIVAGLHRLNSYRLRLGMLGLLAFLSIGTHLGNTLNLVYQADSLRDFWWQVSWRAPQIKPGTTLVANYSVMQAPEDYDVWGPANLIYYPEKQTTLPIHIPVAAALLNDDTVNAVLGQSSGSERDTRGNLTVTDYGSLLILTQATPGSCVRVLDGNLSELSLSDNASIKTLAGSSKTAQILPDANPAIPPALVFGPEPSHAWCYYYQKASLARQEGDWQTVIQLGQQAQSLGFRPNDRIEWLPLLQAYVATDDVAALNAFPGIMNEFPLIRTQTCSALKQTALATQSGNAELMDYIQTKFCGSH